MLNQKITSIIDTFIKQDKMFSAFDVTTAIRNEGISCAHFAMKVPIHDIMTDVIDDGGAGYEKTLVNTGSFTTFVYHPASEDPQTYKKVQTDTSQVQTSTPVIGYGNPTKPVVKKVNHIGSNGRVVNVDGRGRACVPVKNLREGKMKTGDLVTVLTKKNCILMYPHTDGQKADSNVKTYKVDRDNNVRLSSAVLRNAGLQNAQTLSISNSGSAVVVAVCN